jgi:hypothetical protein
MQKLVPYLYWEQNTDVYITDNACCNSGINKILTVRTVDTEILYYWYLKIWSVNLALQLQMNQEQSCWTNNEVTYIICWQKPYYFLSCIGMNKIIKAVILKRDCFMTIFCNTFIECPAAYAVMGANFLQMLCSF